MPRARSFPETNNLLVGYFLGPLRGCPENADVRYIYLALAAPPAYLSALGLTSAYLSVSVTSWPNGNAHVRHDSTQHRSRISTLIASNSSWAREKSVGRGAGAPRPRPHAMAL